MEKRSHEGNEGKKETKTQVKGSKKHSQINLELRILITQYIFFLVHSNSLRLIRSQRAIWKNEVTKEMKEIKKQKLE